MSAESTVSGAPAGRKRRRSALWPIIGVIAAIVIVVVLCAHLWTEVLWYRQVGYSKVLMTRWVTQGILFVIFGGLAAASVWVSMRIAYRSRPIYPPTSQESMNLDRYRQAIEPLRRAIEVILPVIVGAFAGATAAGQWSTFQLLFHQQPFGTTDPQFGFDIGFYVFVLPALRFIVGFGTTISLISGIVAIVTHYLYGGLSLTPGTQRVTKAARVQIGVTGAVFMVFLGVGFWLDQYSMLAATGTKFDGAGYTAVHAVLPAKEIMAAAAVLVAVMFLVAAFRGTWRLPVVGIAVMLVCAIAVSWIFPAAIERFKVQPNAQRLESSYIQRNIKATQAAYGLQDVEVQQYDAETKATPGALRQDAVTTASIRLLDPMIVAPAFRQLQQYRGFYSFPDTLAVDRYDIDGELRDTVIAAREVDLSGLTDSQKTWINEATVYTHGYGVVAAYGNTVDAARKPAFFQEGIPTAGELGDYEPRIYFSPKSPPYSIVGAPKGTKPWELDYPDVKKGGDQQVYTTFAGDGGPKIGSLWNKLLYAIKFGSEQILFSSSVTDESQILYDRSPTTRVEKVAPYLTLDGRTYPAVVDGHIVWIVDGYTTTDTYPYAAVSSLQLATEDSVTARSQSVEALAPAMVNYIRNSVKATVDAYDGTVTLYAWDPDDPILKAWMSVFPATVKPMSEISGPLMSHLRYPEDLFKVQRQLLARYHVTDPETFYTGGDFWRVPDDPTLQNQAQQQQQPPYYLTLQMPSQEAPTFSLTSTFIPASTDSKSARNNLTGYLAVDAEPGNTAGKKAADYGKIRLLQLAGDVPVAGPGQEQSAFASTQLITEQLSLVTTGKKAEVLYGNLLTLPVGGGLLYVQPIYVQGTTGTGNLPFMNMVLVGFGENVAFAPTLDVALDEIFGGDSGASAGDAGVKTDSGAGSGAVEGAVDTTGSGTDSESPPEVAPTPTPTPTATPTAPSTPSGDAQERLNAALQQANQAMQDSQTALANGDWGAYGDAQDRLKAAIDAALAAQAEISGGAGG